MTRLERDVWVAAYAAAEVAHERAPARDAARAVFRLRNPELWFDPMVLVDEHMSRDLFAEVLAFETKALP